MFYITSDLRNGLSGTLYDQNFINVDKFYTFETSAFNLRFNHCIGTETDQRYRKSPKFGHFFRLNHFFQPDIIFFKHVLPFKKVLWHLVLVV